MNFIKKILIHREEKKLFLGMFPVALDGDVEAVWRIIPPSSIPPNPERGVPIFHSEGGDIQLPYRIYNKEPYEILTKILTERQKFILSCIYTRHHNGFIREKHLRKCIIQKEAWIVPFIIILLGDYVLGILKIIETEVKGNTDTTVYKKFIKDNAAYSSYLKSRGRSYWNEYYRKEYKDPEDFPTIQTIKFLEE